MFSGEFLDQLADAVAARCAKRLGAATQQKRLLSIEEAAVYLGRTPAAVEQLVKRGVVPVTKLDGKRQLDRRTLDRLIDERTHYVAA